MSILLKKLCIFAAASHVEAWIEIKMCIRDRSYTYEFKKKIVRLHVEEGRSYKSITEEYGVSKTSQSKWCREFSKKGQTKAEATPEEPNEMDLMKENLSLIHI